MYRNTPPIGAGNALEKVTVVGKFLIQSPLEEERGFAPVLVHLEGNTDLSALRSAMDTFLPVEYFGKSDPER